MTDDYLGGAARVMPVTFLALGLGGLSDIRLKRLSEAERAEVSDFVDFLVTRRSRRSRPRSGPTSGRS